MSWVAMSAVPGTQAPGRLLSLSSPTRGSSPVAPIPHGPHPLLLMPRGLWVVWSLGWKAAVGLACYALGVALGGHRISLNPVSSAVQLRLLLRLAHTHSESKA